MSFDLSQIDEPITEAYLQMYAPSEWAHHNSTAIHQQAYLLDVDSIVDITWDSYGSLAETLLESLGHYLLSGGPLDEYVASDLASAVDIALLEAIRTGDGILAMSLKAPLEDVILEYDSGERDWADTNWVHPASSPRPPRLLLIFDEVPGDFNGDGNVDTADYTIWADNYTGSGGTGGTPSTGDANGDGAVDTADYTIWADSYNGSSAVGAVPEPDVMVLLLSGLLAMLLAHRR
jgi:hypothetical protein